MTQQRARDSRGDRRTQHLQITTTPVPAHKPAGHRLAVRLRKGPAPAGGPTRSSEEAPVMGVERRGRLIAWRVRTSNRDFSSWEETRGQVRFGGQAVRDI